jgi:hypothetical protein
MFLTISEKVKYSKRQYTGPGHSRKMLSISITGRKELDKEMKDRAWHLAQASSPIVVSGSGSVMDVSEEHLRKVSSPIVRESVSVMHVSEEHSS